jgi:hypothetical protein
MVVIGVALLIAIQVAINIVWTFVEPPTFEQVAISTLSSDPFVIYLVPQCSFSPSFLSITLIYLGLLTLWGTLTAIRVRNAPVGFNESFHICVSIGFLACYGALILPLQLLLSDRPDALSFLRAIGMIIGIWVTLACIFVPKILVITEGRADVKESSGATEMVAGNVNANNTKLFHNTALGPGTVGSPLSPNGVMTPNGNLAVPRSGLPQGSPIAGGYVYGNANGKDPSPRGGGPAVNGASIPPPTYMQLQSRVTDLEKWLVSNGIGIPPLRYGPSPSPSPTPPSQPYQPFQQQVQAQQQLQGGAVAAAGTATTPTNAPALHLVSSSTPFGSPTQGPAITTTTNGTHPSVLMFSNLSNATNNSNNSGVNSVRRASNGITVVQHVQPQLTTTVSMHHIPSNIAATNNNNNNLTMVSNASSHQLLPGQPHVDSPRSRPQSPPSRYLVSSGAVNAISPRTSPTHAASQNNNNNNNNNNNIATPATMPPTPLSARSLAAQMNNCMPASVATLTGHESSIFRNDVHSTLATPSAMVTVSSMPTMTTTTASSSLYVFTNDNGATSTRASAPATAGVAM